MFFFKAALRNECRKERDTKLFFQTHTNQRFFEAFCVGVDIMKYKDAGDKNLMRDQ